MLFFPTTLLARVKSLSRHKTPSAPTANKKDRTRSECDRKKKNLSLTHCVQLRFLLAEKERFELSRRYSRPTPLAGAPLRPLEYFSVYSLAGCRFLLPADITYYTQFFPLCQYLFAILSVAFCGFFAFLFFGYTNGGGKTRSCDARREGSDSW